MSLAAVIRVRIATSTTISQANLLGTPLRIYHLAAPQNVKRPYVVYAISDGVPAHHLLGAGGLWEGRVDLDLYSDRVDSMETIVEQIRLTCDGFRGNVTVNSTVYSVRRLHLEAHSEDPQYLDQAKPLPVFHTSLSFGLAVTQSIPVLT